MRTPAILFFASIFWLSQRPGFSQIIGHIGQPKQHDTGSSSAGTNRLTVRAYDTGGSLLGSTHSDAKGDYKLDVANGQQVRLEFSNWLREFSPAPNQPTVHFVTAPAQVNFAVWQPGQYIADNAIAVQSVYTTSHKTKQGGDNVSLIGFAANNSTDKQIFPLATTSQTGSVWGVAYNRVSKQLFAAAFVKRHSPLGPLGIGGLYSVNTVTKITKPFADIEKLGYPVAPAGLTRDLSDKEGVFSHDSLMFSLVGKVGLGGLDVSDDGKYLWTTNLYDRKLYRVSLGTTDTERVPTATDIAGFAIPNTARRGAARPFAVKYYGGKVYVGIIHDASDEKGTADNLRAVVLAFDPVQEKFDEVFSTGLNYPRGSLDYNVSGWRPWTDDYQKTLVPNNNGWMIYPQPMLADIEFDVDGSMILSIMDRLGHQTGEGHLYRAKGIKQLQQIRGLAGGDLLRVAFRPNGYGTGRYELEQNGQAGDRVTKGQGNGEGPNGGEFYFDDAFKANGVTWHHETTAGGLALLPSQDQVLVAAREPEAGGYLGGGVKWFNNYTGIAEHALSLLPKSQANPFGKANNVGDIELITELPATQIGDRIWQDCDKDGIQDADESPLAGVTVGLYRDGKLIATTKTDSIGHYLFSNEEVRENILPRTAYELRVALKQSAKPELTLTTAHTGDNPEVDNDAILVDGSATIRFETKAPGENIRNLDFGFFCLDKPQVAAKLTCYNDEATLTLTGHKTQDRFDLVADRVYNGNASYSKALVLPKNGQVLTDRLSNWPDELTVRVFNNTGCFTDVSVNRSSATGCARAEGEGTLGLVASPNPTSDFVLINYKSLNQQGSVQLLVVDAQGKTISSQQAELKQGRYQTQINLSRQPQGSYIATIQDGEQKISQTIIKR